jgi:hypothetical protein
MQLDENETAAVMDEFNLFLFEVSEVAWFKGKRNILRFQGIIRRYREMINNGNWNPSLPGIIEDMARYSQADRNAPPPLVRSGGGIDISGMLSRTPFLGRLQDICLRHNKKRREFVAGLLPRVAMLPLKHIYWLEDDAVQCIERGLIESQLGGITVARQPDNRLVIRIPG